VARTEETNTSFKALTLVVSWTWAKMVDEREKNTTATIE
jgi:hypothetical protein